MRCSRWKQRGLSQSLELVQSYILRLWLAGWETWYVYCGVAGKPRCHISHVSANGS